jgi:glycerol kinase
MVSDSGVDVAEMRVDGGMTANSLLMQFQADLLGVEVVRPEITETTALGAAYAAGLASGFWDSTDQLRALWSEDRRWKSTMDAEQRDRLVARWKKAIGRSLDWV